MKIGENDVGFLVQRLSQMPRQFDAPNGIDVEQPTLHGAIMRALGASSRDTRSIGKTWKSRPETDCFIAARFSRAVPPSPRP